jgi:AcrR family transcriptional regulator
MTSASETKHRVLEVAESLFGELGVDRVSIRDITEAAKVNVAAVNYHFGSKEELIAAVFERRLAPLNSERLRLLDQVEAKSGTSGPSVEQILEAFVHPALRCCQENANSNSAFARLLGRCLAETRPEVEVLLREQFAPVAARFEKALMKACPHLPRSDVYWRLKFTFGALHHWLMTREKFIPNWAEKTSVDDQVSKLITFTAAGFRA